MPFQSYFSYFKSPLLLFFLTSFLLNLPVYVQKTTNYKNNINHQQHTIKINQQPIQVEIAKTATEQQKGLMHRQYLAPNHGMLFIFEHSQELCFWMKNTYIPLSIAYLDKAYKIVDIFDMSPLDESPVCSTQKSQY